MGGYGLGEKLLKDIWTHSQEFGDGIRLGTADAAVTRPDDPPLGGGDGVWLFCALRAHSGHTPVIRRACGQRLLCVELPCRQIGDRNEWFQHCLRGKQRNNHLLDFSVLTLHKGAVSNISHCRISARISH